MQSWAVAPAPRPDRWRLPRACRSRAAGKGCGSGHRFRGLCHAPTVWPQPRPHRRRRRDRRPAAADHHQWRLVALQRDHVTAADLPFGCKAEVFEEPFHGQIQRGFQGSIPACDSRRESSATSRAMSAPSQRLMDGAAPTCGQPPVSARRSRRSRRRLQETESLPRVPAASPICRNRPSACWRDWPACRWSKAARH